MKNNYIFVVIEGYYGEKSVVLATNNLDKAVDTAITTERDPYFQIWENEKLKYEYGIREDIERSKEKILKYLKESKII